MDMNKKRFWAFLLLGCGLVYLTSCQSDTSVHPSGGQAPTTLPSHTEAETSGHSPASTHSTQAPLSKTDMKRKILSDYHISLEDLSRCYLNEPQDTEAEQLHILSKRLDVRFPTPLKMVHFENQRSCLFAQLQYDEDGFRSLQSLLTSDGYPNFETPDTIALVNEKDAPDWWYTGDSVSYAKSWSTFTHFVEVEKNSRLEEDDVVRTVRTYSENGLFAISDDKQNQYTVFVKFELSRIKPVCYYFYADDLQKD